MSSQLLYHNYHHVKFAVTMLICTQTEGCVVTVCSVLKLFGDCFDLNFLAYYLLYYTSAAYTCMSCPCAHMRISGRDVQKVIPSVVILRGRRGHGGERFVGVVNSQRYKYSSCGTFTAVHIHLRYVSTVNAVGRAFLFLEPGCPSWVSISCLSQLISR